MYKQHRYWAIFYKYRSLSASFPRSFLRMNNYLNGRYDNGFDKDDLKADVHRDEILFLEYNAKYERWVLYIQKVHERCDLVIRSIYVYRSQLLLRRPNIKILVKTNK